MSDNPLISDVELQNLLSNVDTLESEKEFVKWRKSFLKVYSSYLDPDGVLNAKDANYRLLKKLMELTNRGLKIQALIKNDSIRSDQVTTEGRRGLTNLSDELAAAEKAINEFMPKTTADEDRVGYDKYELAAVLVSDGFHGYDLMVKTRDFLEQTTSESLSGVVDANFMQVFRYYSTALDVFIQVMEDLGLFKIMKQCVEVVYKDKKRAEPKAPPPQEMILKTTTTTRKVRHPDGEGEGSDPEGEHGKDHEDATSTKKDKHSGRKSGGATGGANGRGRANQNQMGDTPNEETPEPPKEEEEEEKDEDDGQGEAEFLIYFDPKTNALGLLERNACGAKSKLLVDMEKEGTEAYQGVIEDDDEKQQIIWLLKKLEKTRPVEVSWLEEIKKEKAMKKGSDVPMPKDGRKMPSGTKRSSAKSTGTGTRRSSKQDGKAPTLPDGPGFRDPFGGPNYRDPWAAAPPPEGDHPKKKKVTVENYQGKYRQIAAKPANDGWKKIG